MKMEPRCLPCAMRRLLATAQRISDDPWVHFKLLKNAMGELVHVDRDRTPAELIAELQSVVGRTLGTTDPYQQDRKEWWDELEPSQEALRARIAAAAEPLRAALHLATAGNALDDECLSRHQVREALRWTWTGSQAEEPAFHATDLERFVTELRAATRLVFVHDSGPELIFDRLVVEQLIVVSPALRIRCVVRAQPILLDATHEDLERSGILALPGVEGANDPGIVALGVPLDECGRELREVFEAADLVLAKGQAAYETLHDSGKPCYFAMRVKCPVMADVQGVPPGELLFTRG